jgi:ribose 5-phosphate isomerase B
MQIYLASDHAGFYLKEKVKENFLDRGFLVEDFGARNFDEIDDYPDFIFPCVKKYIEKTNGDTVKGFAIIFGGSGTGEAIVANRVRGARAVVYNGNSPEIVRLGREHNDTNILSIGTRFVTEKECLEAIKIFMTTSFEGGKHAKRVLKIDMIQ